MRDSCLGKFWSKLQFCSKLQRQIRNCKESNFGHAVDDDTTTVIHQMTSGAPAGEAAETGTNQQSSPGSPMSTTSSSPNSGEDNDFKSSFGNKNRAANGERDVESMRNSVSDMQQRLKVQRQMAGRPQDLQDMTQEQVLLIIIHVVP